MPGFVHPGSQERHRMIELPRVDDAIRAVNRRRYAALILHWAFRPLGYIEFSDVYCIDPHALPPPRELDRYVIEHAADTDIDYICRFLPRDEPPHVIRKLSSEGHHCFVARYDGKVIAYDWIAFSPVQEEEYRIEISPGDAFCLNAYTIPQHRGKGVHFVLLRALLQFAAQAGKSRVFTAVSLFNVRSWKSHVRMGWRRISTLGYFRPNFTFSRVPWQFTARRYPVHLDWKRHAWLDARKSDMQA
jgi:GNAT superfamily N-acetyltransferase